MLVMVLQYNPNNMKRKKNEKNPFTLLGVQLQRICPAGQLTLVNCSHPIPRSTWNSTWRSRLHPTAPHPAPLLRHEISRASSWQSMVASKVASAQQWRFGTENRRWHGWLFVEQVSIYLYFYGVRCYINSFLSVWQHAHAAGRHWNVSRLASPITGQSNYISWSAWIYFSRPSGFLFEPIGIWTRCAVYYRWSQLDWVTLFRSFPGGRDQVAQRGGVCVWRGGMSFLKLPNRLRLSRPIFNIVDYSFNICKEICAFSKQFVQTAPHIGLPAKACNLLKIFSSSLKSKYLCQ